MTGSVALRRASEAETASTPSLRLPLIVGVLLGHALLAWLMSQNELVATLHALATFAAGMVLALRGSQKQAAYAVAYIAGAEVLWRMTGANIFWEYGKYATVAILGVALLRSRSTRIPRLALLYFVFLLPSVVLTIAQFPLGEAREQISFNLSGPLALFVCVWFFSSLELKEHEFERMVTGFGGPAAGIATLALVGILRANGIRWVADSSVAASGGFGPNQVSSALALGVLLIFLLLLFERVSTSKQLLFGLLGVWLLAQSALTFSRGGFVTTAVASIAALLHALFIPERRRKALVLALGSVAIAAFLLFPYLDQVTGGALAERYSDTDLTNRGTLMRDDVRIFLENPFTGVGPGVAGRYRTIRAAAHTEFTRLLAEHGFLGAGAILLLAELALRAYSRPGQTATGRALVAALTLWAFAYMMHSAMRLVDTAFAFGLVFAALVHETEQSRGK